MTQFTAYTRLRRWVGPCAAWRVARLWNAVVGLGQGPRPFTNASQRLDGGL